jgi:transcriptional regulator with XRE-family HTH domain
MPRVEMVVLLGSAVRERRLLRSMTRPELAQKAGCSRRSIWVAETTGRVSFATAKRIAAALKVKVGGLIVHEAGAAEEGGVASKPDGATEKPEAQTDGEVVRVGREAFFRG